MNKKMLVVGMFALLLIAAGCAKKIEQNPQESQAPQTENSEITDSNQTNTENDMDMDSKNKTKSAQFQPLTASNNGIDAIVESVDHEGENTVITITLDNHAIDVSGTEAKNFSSFAKEKPLSYTVEGSGHHATGKMTFKGHLSGEFIFGLDNKTKFKFNIE